MKGGAGRLAISAMLLGVVALICAGTSEASAASRVCRQLEAELASLGNGGRASPTQIGKYDSAITRQGQELAKARSRAQRAGCGFSIFGGNIAACAALNASIDRMNANLDKLRGQRSRLATGGTRRDRARILASLDANDCRSRKAVQKSAAEARGTASGQANWAAGGNERYAQENDGSGGSGTTGYVALAELSFERPPRPRGEFRTMCVRTCDGYFFPMSNAATVGDFERDQKNCESSCPGTDIQVFYMRGLDGDTATMTSATTGRPYQELPTAFLYKKPTPVGAPVCGCNAAPGYQVIGGAPRSPALRSAPQSPSITSFAAAPSAAPAPAPKPAQGSRDDEATTKPATRLPADRKVRVVAPAFLPAPEAAIDLQAPAPTPAR